MKSRYIFVILLLDDIGKINFYNDLYQRDDRLADLLFSKFRVRLIKRLK
jgi:hypothetical protein